MAEGKSGKHKRRLLAQHVKSRRYVLRARVAGSMILAPEWRVACACA
jgi:hypothetical protein